MYFSRNGSDIEIMGFDDRLLRLIGIPLLGLIVPFFFFNATFDMGADMLFAKWVISTTYTLIYWQACRFFIIRLRRKMPNPDQVMKRIGLTVGFMTILIMCICTPMDHLIWVRCFGAVAEAIKPSPIAIYSASFMNFFLLLAIYEGVYFFNKYKNVLLEKEKLEKENIHSQLETLKSQVNPHFLFNSLNTLASIIPEAPDTAVDFVQKLSKVYRYILEIREQKTILLSEELAALEAYAFLLKIRFGENLHLTVNVPEDYHSRLIVPLSLQILIENAVKHNIVSTQKPLFVEVDIQSGDKLVVRNNLQRKNQVMSSTKFGLENIRQRYQLLSGQQAEVIVTAERFTVVLPLLKPSI